MSTPVFRGSATVEGTIATYDCFFSTNSPRAQSIKASQAWEEELIKDEHGFDNVWLLRNEHATLDIDLYIVASTAAIAATPVKIPASDTTSLSAIGQPFFGVGTVLTISAATLTTLNGVWRVLNGTKGQLTNTGAVKYSLKLLKYANADQNTAMATIPA